MENIYKSKIVEDAAKRFRKLYEYSFNIQEDEEETSTNNPQENNNDGEVGDMNNPDINNMDMNNAPTNGNENNLDGNNQPTNNEVQGLNPEQGMSNMTPDTLPTDAMQPEDEVIDVDDLTNSQEETEEKVEDLQVSMKHGFSKLLKVVDKLNQMIDASTENMNQIKKEIEKRNPTPIEKLNMRTANDSYPFNVSPNDYWKNKEQNSNYRIGGENEEDAEQYTITQGDIDRITDFRQISNDLNTSSYNQNLMNIFGLR